MSGAGYITYSALTPFSAQYEIPDCGNSWTTAESSNSTYGPLPQGAYTSFVQAFRIPKWTEVPTGCATSIAAGDGTSPWIIGCPESSGQTDLGVYYWDPWSGSAGAWIHTNGSGVNIAAIATSDGNIPMYVNSAGAIFLGQYVSDIEGSNGTTTVSWTQLFGCATSISGSGGYGYLVSPGYPTVYVTGCTPTEGGYVPYISANGLGVTQPSDWSSLGEGGVRISASTDGTDLWLVKSNHEIDNYQSGSGWQKQGGEALDVSAGTSAGSVVQTDQQMYQLNAGAWIGRPPWIVGTNNVLYQWNGSGWTLQSGGPAKAQKVSIGQNGTVWVIDTDGNIWFYN